MEANINASIHGKPKLGDKLFIVTFIDEEDLEDTIIEVWVAKDENELYDLVQSSKVPDDMDEEDEALVEMKSEFADDWGLKILYKEIGKFPSAQRMCKCPKGNLCDQCDIHGECNYLEK